MNPPSALVATASHPTGVANKPPIIIPAPAPAHEEPTTRSGKLSSQKDFPSKHAGLIRMIGVSPSTIKFPVAIEFAFIAT